MGSRRRLTGRRWQSLRREVAERDGWRCRWCPATAQLTTDHVVELRDGGSDDPRNLMTLCLDCHVAKTEARERAVSRLIREHWAEYRRLHERAVDDARRARGGGRRAW